VAKLSVNPYSGKMGLAPLGHSLRGVGSAHAFRMLRQSGRRLAVASFGLLKVFAKGKPSQQPQLKMNPNKALWEKGDFTRIAETMRESGHTLVQRLGITKGMKVLDLGCGDGTTALPA